MFLYSGGKSVDAVPSDEMKEIMAKWMAWFGAIGDNMVDGGNPFNKNGQEVSSKGTKDIASDTWSAKGYTLVNAENIEAAVEISKGCPIIEEGGSIRVYEAMPM